MGVPSKKRTKGQKRRRASHFALTPIALSICPKCKRPLRPHRACSFCGYYRGKKIFTIATKSKQTKKG